MKERIVYFVKNHPYLMSTEALVVVASVVFLIFLGLYNAELEIEYGAFSGDFFHFSNILKAYDIFKHNQHTSLGYIGTGLVLLALCVAISIWGYHARKSLYGYDQDTASLIVIVLISLINGLLALLILDFLVSRLLAAGLLALLGIFGAIKLHAYS